VFLPIDVLHAVKANKCIVFPFVGVHYGGSVPASKVMDGLGDAIFAYEMNDEPVSQLQSM
jgi:DMSO/TMAO reductase YedYZ molybdopterin-dependent catalytic subunit